MLKIRLSRFGSRNNPTYRLIINEHAKDTYGYALEYLGLYNPKAEPKITQLKEDRIKYWLSQGAQPSPTVHNLLVEQGIIEGKKVRAWAPKKKEQEKKAEGGGAGAKEEAKEESEKTKESAEAQAGSEGEKKEAQESAEQSGESDNKEEDQNNKEEKEKQEAEEKPVEEEKKE